MMLNNDNNCGLSDIQKDSVYRVNGEATGKSISCLEGTIWITQQGDGFDRILNAGERYETKLRSDVLIQAMDPARVRVCGSEKNVFANTFSRPLSDQPANA